jgi:hypothetical protein
MVVRLGIRRLNVLASRAADLTLDRPVAAKTLSVHLSGEELQEPC